MVKEVRVGLVGLGTIGSGVVEILRDNAGLIERRTGVRITLAAACDRFPERAQELKLAPGVFTNDYKQLIANPNIDVIIELIGGYEPAHAILLEAIRAKKHVITANKAVLAKFGYELFDEAHKNGVNVLFEAAVGGCIPIIRTIEESYSSDTIESIYGILNGTTNYVLSRMEEGMSYADALKQAQTLGFAEANPSFDVEGKDAAQKLSILASLAFDARIEQDIPAVGIAGFDARDMAYAKKLGYVVKLLAVAKNGADGVELRVHPALVPAGSMLASVKDEFNAIRLSGKNTGEIFLSGKGAGKLPTATVVITDIIEMGSRTRVAQRSFAPARIKPIGETSSRYYLRMEVANQPGVLAAITKILGEKRISIAAVTQAEEESAVVPVILLTYETREESIAAAVKEICVLPIIKAPPVALRIETLR